MQTRSLLLLVAGLALATQVTGTVYDRCGVAKALSAQGFPKAQLNDSLLDSNIANDAKCAKLIYARHGFNAWYGWINGCKGRSLPDVSSCL
ncbi:hypothetical protein C0J52_00630 [Blattella germanica]|nr:hypothetical protein C0J52_00630 [Blattella germanica]